MGNDKTETMISVENKQEATEVMEILNEFTPGEKKELLMFMQGIKYAKSINDRAAV